MGALVALLAAAMAAAASPAPASARAASTAWLSANGLTPDPDVQFGQLPNGMRTLIRRSVTPPGVISIRLRIGTGSLNETDQQRGVAHLLEHLVLNGTRNVPEGEFMRRAERLGLRPGADTNATTDLQQTVYRLDLPRNDPPSLDTALFLLREVADRATLAPDALDRERLVVLAEERARFTPLQKAGQASIAWHFKGQPIADRSPIGTITSIQTVPRAEVLKFYQAWYRPENATLIISGDIDPAVVEARIRASFADWKGEGPAGVRVDEGRPATRGLDQAIVTDPTIPLGLTVSWLRPVDPRDSRARRLDDLRQGIVVAILNRRLQQLAQSGTDAPFASAQVRSNRIAQSGALTEIGIQTRGIDWRRGLTAASQEQRRLLRYGVNQSEIAPVVAGVRTLLQTVVRAKATLPSRALADQLLAQVNNGVVPLSPEAQLALFEDAARTVDPKGLRGATEQLFAGSGPLIYFTAPKGLPAGSPTPTDIWTKAAELTLLAPVEQARVAWPYTPSGTPGQVAERTELKPLGATAVRFANGVRLLVRPNRARDDQVLVRVSFGGGRAELSATRPSPEWAFGPTLIGGGTRQLAIDDLQRAVADKLTGLSFSAGDTRFALSGATRTEDLPTELQLLAAYLREPGWRPSGFEQARVNIGRLIQASGSTPTGLLTRELPGILLKDDPRYRLPPLRTIVTTTANEVRAVLEPELGKGPLEIVVAGDVQPDAVIRAVAATFGTFPARPALTPVAIIADFPDPGKAPRLLIHRGRADQAMVAVAWPTLGLFGNLRETRTLSLLSTILQQRMSDRLREQMGSTYTPVSQHVASRAWSTYGYLLAASELPLDRLGEGRDAIRALAAGLADKPVEADELDRARQPILLNFQREEATNEYWLGVLPDVLADPRMTQVILTRDDDYRAITAAELQTAARKYLRPAAAYEIDVVGLPESTSASASPPTSAAPPTTPVPPPPPPVRR